MTLIEKFEKQHLENTYHWMQDQSLKDSFLLRKDVSRESHQIWFENVNNDETQLIFAIKYNDYHCGNCGLKNINYQNNNAELWIYLGNHDFRGKGIAQGAIQLLINHAFNDLKLHKIYSYVLESNKASLHAFEKRGFVAACYLKDEVYYNNEYVSLYRMEILNE